MIVFINEKYDDMKIKLESQQKENLAYKGCIQI